MAYACRPPTSQRCAASRRVSHALKQDDVAVAIDVRAPDPALSARAPDGVQKLLAAEPIGDLVLLPRVFCSTCRMTQTIPPNLRSRLTLVAGTADPQHLQQPVLLTEGCVIAPSSNRVKVTSSKKQSSSSGRLFPRLSCRRTAVEPQCAIQFTRFCPKHACGKCIGRGRDRACSCNVVQPSAHRLPSSPAFARHACFCGHALQRFLPAYGRAPSQINRAAIL